MRAQRRPAWLPVAALAALLATSAALARLNTFDQRQRVAASLFEPHAEPMEPAEAYELFDWLLVFCMATGDCREEGTDTERLKATYAAMFTLALHCNQSALDALEAQVELHRSSPNMLRMLEASKAGSMAACLAVHGDLRGSRAGQSDRTGDQQKPIEP